MLKEIKLPNYLFPFQVESLVRVGNNFDGSYLIDKDSVLNSELLISIGVGWSFDFEKNFLEINNVPLIAFDGSAGIVATLKKIKFRTIQTIKKKEKKYFLDSIYYFSYIFRFYLFFKNFRNIRLNKNYRKFVKKFVGPEEGEISISQILKKFDSENKFNKVFFQIDIEGGEYVILQDLIDHQHMISGLVIEFHDIHQHLNKIKEFIDSLNLNLIHTHINNVGGTTPEGSPKVIELTFANCKVFKKVDKLPHNLDQPNSSEHFEYIAYLN